ncbi:MAG TPA: IS481 family transposase [Actinomycetota bacterium]|nr:IS481 family transposase [Actinomycetota bacterium]
MTHARAKLTRQGRLLLVTRVLQMGWSVPMAAEAQGCSAATGYKWIRRFQAEGPEGLRDRSSRPHRSPGRLSPGRERAILERRARTLEGPHRIAWALGEAPATVHRVLRRLGAPRLRDLDRPTRMVVRYERDRPGELVHVDIKKQGRIPAGGGWRVHGRAAAHSRHRGDGYDFIHAAVDDRSRLAYAEILPDERKETASAFMTRAIRFYADHGVRVERVLTDNGSCYRSREFAKTLTSAGIAHRRTRPYRPQTNGKVERFNLSLKWEWAYARAYETNSSRTEELERWVHHYNYQRPHMALSGRAPITAVNNVPRKHS